MPKLVVTSRRKHGVGAAILCVIVSALVSSCATGVGAPNDPRKHVVTTFTVLADMTRAVAGDTVSVESITKPGSEIHEYQPTPSDLMRGARADLVLDNGFGLERWFERFLDQTESPHVTLTDGVEPISIGDRDTSDGRAVNPHAWMSPANAKIYVANIRDALVELEPAHAAEFHANANAYLAELDAIERTLAAELRAVPEPHRALVTCEGAFSYLARDAGLREAYLWPVNSDQEGTPQQVKNTTAFVRDNDVPAVFCESTVNPQAQHQVAEEADARFAGTLYVDSLSAPDGPVPTYLDLLRHDTRTILDGLGGTNR
ncbi:metal ABC transporter substrate-binding protein [Allosaccharopolyspora coralli]|uniref:Metal ABC transporter substrate-binding protein n=1 Tax=Allosaccharopolyspora coralli TaxID=2665642 RepID=A0A5Q3QHT5_9PSEU|nr:metal ABC transporter substrate-binding protein [Allosaccharopolyspora coralli]QGK71019.1 metal ABC transporter substrate-binding protein [Allosaccharopolyspora coralli]